MPVAAPAFPLLVDRLDSPLGPLVVAVSPAGLAAILFGPDVAEAAAVLRAELGHAEPAAGRADDVRRQLAEYFAGTRQDFTLPLDLRGTPFQLEVWQALARVPFGATRSYGDLAAMTGRRGGSRAVGQAVRRNRIPIVVPCHRIIAADGGLGGYGGRWADGGVYSGFKRQLLDLERRQPS